MQNTVDIIDQFAIKGRPVSSAPFGNGHINSTFKIECDNGNAYLLQRINDSVFSDVGALMKNIDGVTSFLKRKIAENGGNPERETVNIVKTKNGKLYLRQEDGSCWRAYVFIRDTVTPKQVDDPHQFYLIGKTVGRFQVLLSDYPAETLAEVLPSFHNTAARYAEFESLTLLNNSERAGSVSAEISLARGYRLLSRIFPPLIEQKILPLRVTHNDTKPNNVMFDTKTNAPVCLVDLDTIMPGLSLYDFGDSIRVGACSTAEDEADLSKVHFELEMFEAFTKGFLEECGGILTKEEKELLHVAPLVMTYEQAIRFLGDYIDGDRYYKTSREDQNLDRARVQLRLLEDMESKLGTMRAIVGKYV